ncbi:hypothetical protein OAA19_02665 [Rubripirellula sp.]|nr:hypothetical protein [Rubripirellula sp.]MDB4338992.1 hypothetical protein [Rubripirellula sp.]
MKWRSSGETIVTQHSTPSRTGEFSLAPRIVALGCAAGDMAFQVSLAGALDVLISDGELAHADLDANPELVRSTE